MSGKYSIYISNELFVLLEIKRYFKWQGSHFLRVCEIKRRFLSNLDIQQGMNIQQSRRLEHTSMRVRGKKHLNQNMKESSIRINSVAGVGSGPNMRKENISLSTGQI